jgi:hypothetical protein
LVNTFGKPDANTFIDFFTAANFLSYAKNLKVVRAVNPAAAVNASDGTEAILIKNKNHYELNYLDLSANANVGFFAAKYPGVLGTGLKVGVWSSANATAFAAWTYAEEFNGAPGTSNFAAAVNGANDELHIIVLDGAGKFTGIANTVLEKFSYLSKAGNAKNDDGSSNYYVNVISDRSKYIYVANHGANGTNWGAEAANTTFSAGDSSYLKTLVGGADGVPADADRITAYDMFANPEEIDVSLVMAANASTTVAAAIKDLVDGRKDAVGFVSPLMTDVVDNDGGEVDDITTYRNAVGSSSYMVMDSGWKYQFDKYNNVYRWVPLNGDIAGLCVRTDFERDPWFSPAGFNRGQIRNVIKLAWNPTKAERDDLYKIGVNPVVAFPGEGVVLFGDKTLQSKPSAFDRINVRRLFIVLEKAIARAAKYSLFEFNDAFTRAQFVALVEPYLRDVQGRRGIYDFRVVCDETNNTPEVIDRNEFIGDIYIKPARSINFIQLNFVAVRTGVAFDEIVGKW